MKAVLDSDLSSDTRVSTSLISARYRSIGLIRFPVGNNSELVYSRLNRSADILPSNIAGLLERCNQFKSLDEHSQECYRGIQAVRQQNESMISQLSAQVFPEAISRLLTLLKGYALKQVARREGAQADLIRNTLGQLAQAGFMVSEEELAWLCKKHKEEEAGPSGLTTIGIMQRGGTDRLQRCLVSYIENVRKYGRSNTFVVVDGSQSREARKATRNLLQAVSSRDGVMIGYAGLEEKVSYAETLVTRGLPEEVVNFALFGLERCGNGTGANRNAILLHTTGEMLFSADEDTVCSASVGRNLRECLALDSRPEPAEISFFADRESALGSVVAVEKDILAAHEELLGRKLGSCLSASGATPELDLDNLDWRFVRSLGSGEGRVLITMNGVVEDSGMGFATNLLCLTGESRKRLMRSESSYRSACSSQTMIRVPRNITINNRPFCTTTCIGFDNRNLLPPFLPVNKNEGAVFGSTLLNCFEPVYCGHLPFLLLHVPNESRPFSPDGIWAEVQQQSSDLIRHLIESVELKPGISNERERMRAIGERLMEQASMPFPDFLEFVRVQRWQHLSRQIGTLENLLRAYGRTPDFWAKDVERHIDVLREALEDENCGLSPDSIYDHRNDEACKLDQRIVFNFGQMLYWWPEIVDVAKSLRAQERRLAVMH